MPCLLPDLERGDARPRRARREAGAQAMTRVSGRVEPCGSHSVPNDQGHGFAGESTDRNSPVSIDGPEYGPPSIRAALSQVSSALTGQWTGAKNIQAPLQRSAT